MAEGLGAKEIAARKSELTAIVKNYYKKRTDALVNNPRRINRLELFELQSYMNKHTDKIISIIENLLDNLITYIPQENQKAVVKAVAEYASMEEIPAIGGILDKVAIFPAEIQVGLVTTLAANISAEKIPAIGSILDKVTNFPKENQVRLVEALASYLNKEEILAIGSILDKVTNFPKENQVGLVKTLASYLNKEEILAFGSLLNKVENYPKENQVGIVQAVASGFHIREIATTVDILDKGTKLPKENQAFMLELLALHAKPATIDLAIDNIIAVNSGNYDTLCTAISAANRGNKIAPAQAQQPALAATELVQDQQHQVG